MVGDGQKPLTFLFPPRIALIPSHVMGNATRVAFTVTPSPKGTANIYNLTYLALEIERQSLCTRI